MLLITLNMNIPFPDGLFKCLSKQYNGAGKGKKKNKMKKTQYCVCRMRWILSDQNSLLRKDICKVEIT